MGPPQHNTLIGLQVTKLCDLASDTPADTISSVAWSLRGTYLAIGTNRGDTQLWDVVKAVRWV